jgi:hypothetical protein
MELLLILMASVAFIVSTISITLACYLKNTLEAQLVAKISGEIYSA